MKNILLFTTFILYCTSTFSQCWESIDVKGDTNKLQLAIQHNGTLWDLTPGNTPSQIGNDDKDRKSTRLNSSHVRISYAVFCLKKKKKKKKNIKNKKKKKKKNKKKKKIKKKKIKKEDNNNIKKREET